MKKSLVVIMDKKKPGDELKMLFYEHIPMIYGIPLFGKKSKRSMKLKQKLNRL